MRKPARFDFPTALRGDTVHAWEIQILEGPEGEETPLDLTGATVEMPLKGKKGGAVVFEMPVSIQDPENGMIYLDSFIPTIAPYTYWYDLVVRMGNGEVVTYFQGEYKIKQDV